MSILAKGGGVYLKFVDNTISLYLNKKLKFTGNRDEALEVKILQVRSPVAEMMHGNMQTAGFTPICIATEKNEVLAIKNKGKKHKFFLKPFPLIDKSNYFELGSNDIIDMATDEGIFFKKDQGQSTIFWGINGYFALDDKSKELIFVKEEADQFILEPADGAKSNKRRIKAHDEDSIERALKLRKRIKKQESSAEESEDEDRPAGSTKKPDITAEEVKPVIKKEREAKDKAEKEAKKAQEALQKAREVAEQAKADEEKALAEKTVREEELKKTEQAQQELQKKEEELQKKYDKLKKEEEEFKKMKEKITEAKRSTKSSETEEKEKITKRKRKKSVKIESQTSEESSVDKSEIGKARVVLRQNNKNIPNNTIPCQQQFAQQMPIQCIPAISQQPAQPNFIYPNNQFIQPNVNKPADITPNLYDFSLINQQMNKINGMMNGSVQQNCNEPAVPLPPNCYNQMMPSQQIGNSQLYQSYSPPFQLPEKPQLKDLDVDTLKRLLNAADLQDKITSEQDESNDSEETKKYKKSKKKSTTRKKRRHKKKSKTNSQNDYCWGYFVPYGIKDNCIPYSNNPMEFNKTPSAHHKSKKSNRHRSIQNKLEC
ncbi:hypothetical protein NUSPORA_00967 [Nucleospora cyclopteri]